MINFRLKLFRRKIGLLIWGNKKNYNNNRTIKLIFDFISS